VIVVYKMFAKVYNNAGMRNTHTQDCQVCYGSCRHATADLRIPECLQWYFPGNPSLKDDNSEEATWCVISLNSLIDFVIKQTGSVPFSCPARKFVENQLHILHGEIKAVACYNCCLYYKNS
jgi:hypothetical protein